MKQLSSSELQQVSGASLVVNILDPGFSMDMSAGFDTAFNVPMVRNFTVGNNFYAVFGRDVINEGASAQAL